MTTVDLLPCIVGALSCQKDSYLQSLTTQVVSCTEYALPKQATIAKSKSKKPQDNGTSSADSQTWLLEFADSVLFPEGGGQPTDHGTVTPIPLSGGPAESEAIPIPIPIPIPLTNLQRHGLRCIAYSPKPLQPGTSVRQDVDFGRRWDHMQQHTGQHLLSAIMDTMQIETVGWSMGSAGEMNYVELSRKPSEEEYQSIQQRCTSAIRENLPITVETPGAGVKADSLPDDYDKEKGVVRFIKIGDLDYNACCGTHLRQTSHISLILLHHTQTVRGTNCRLFFSCGDRALALATSSLNSIRNMAVALSSGSTANDVESTVKRLTESLSDSRRREKKMLADIARFEAARIISDLQSGKNGWCHRATDGLDFINLVVIEVKDAVKEKGAVVLVSGQEKEVGSIMIIGEAPLVDKLAAKVKETVATVKGGGKGRWQGKVTEWKKGEIEALKRAVEE